MLTIIRKSIPAPTGRLCTGLTSSKEAFQIEIIDGERSAHSVVASINDTSICPFHGTPSEYAKVIRDAVSTHLAKRASLKKLPTAEAQSEYAHGKTIYFFDENGGLNEVEKNTEFFDFPNRCYHI